MASIGEVDVAVLFPDGEADSKITTSIKEQRTGTPLKVWVGTALQYEAITTKDSTTLYMVDA